MIATVKGNYFTVDNEVLCINHNLLLPHNYIMQPYEKVVCQYPHTKKILHRTHSIISSQALKADA